MSKVRIIPREDGGDIVKIEDCKVVTPFNNFSGNYGYNGAQDPNRRTMTIIIDDENVAQYLTEHNWRVKLGQNGEKLLPINVSYRFYDPTSENPIPTIIKIDPKTGIKMNMLEETVGQLDDFRVREGFKYCDVLFKGSLQKDGMISAYLHWMQVIPNYSEAMEEIANMENSLESKIANGWEEA